MKKIPYNGQMRNEHFLIVIYHSSLVRAAVNGLRICKLRSGVKKCLNFFFFNGQRWTKCAVNILCSYLNWWHNWQLKSSRRSHNLKGSRSMVDGRIFLKTCRDVSFIKSYRMSLISAGSILLDITFKSSSHVCCTNGRDGSNNTSPLTTILLPSWSVFPYLMYTVKKAIIFPVPYRPGRVWLVTSRLGTGKNYNFLTV